MERLSGYDWDGDYHYEILIITEEDVQNETNYKGAGFDVVIIPKKFKEDEEHYVTTLRMLVSIKRNGRIIYI